MASLSREVDGSHAGRDAQVQEQDPHGQNREKDEPNRDPAVAKGIPNCQDDKQGA
jgi:hypothetical protein